ncbi:MAG: 3-deoxy-manno-octulosonate cytidylyltransferase [Lewinellaceae bacterium]|nr:3-deoxy-manno-octulosonate cytidylyltransferase [Lewinellaceae bacterium]
MKSLGIIPARYASTRFPGKPLADMGGQTMIQRVYEKTMQSRLDEVVVATDDDRIYDHVLAFGGRVVMTSSNLPSGTDRCAAVAEQKEFSAFDNIINVQGDEPFIRPEQIDTVLATLETRPGCGIATLAKQLDMPEELFNPNVVKVVFGKNNQALYFSRSPVPFVRGQSQTDWIGNATFYKHIGLYGYRREVLLELAKLPIGALEKAESLEQLRWLENGYAIGIGITSFETRGIDTLEDLRLAMAEHQINAG